MNGADAVDDPVTSSLANPVVGLVLAAGAGSRLGTPKALLRDETGQTWLSRALGVLRAGGCLRTYAVLGAAAERVAAEVPAGVSVLVADDWAEGMGASLRAGLTVVADDKPQSLAVVVMLVDTPGVTGEVVSRLVAQGMPYQADPRVPRAQPTATALARATYDGALGHPVLIGRAHWLGVAESAIGDRGARDYLQSHDVTLVECADIGSGVDIDTQEALSSWQAAGRG